MQMKVVHIPLNHGMVLTMKIMDSGAYIVRPIRCSISFARTVSDAHGGQPHTSVTSIGMALRGSCHADQLMSEAVCVSGRIQDQYRVDQTLSTVSAQKI